MINENFRIANWNLERPHKKSAKLDLAIQKIKEINPDIIVLTESSGIVDLGPEYHVAHSEEYEDLPLDQWAAIYSKWPINKQIKTSDEHGTTCSLIGAPFGELIVYATIIPYHNAGVCDGGKYAYAPRKYKPWEMHKENIISQGADWKRIAAEYPGVLLVVAGDFNQTRDKQKWGYGTKDVRDMLTRTLEHCNLTCLTEEDLAANGKLKTDPKKGYPRRNIDHICLTTEWVEQLNYLYVGAWDHFTEQGKYMSDHNGVFMDFNMPR